MAVGCFGNTVILWALAGGDNRASSAKDPLLAWQVIYRESSKAPRFSALRWCIWWGGFLCSGKSGWLREAAELSCSTLWWSRHRTSACQGRWHQHSWAASPQHSAEGQGLSICGLAQHSCLILGDAAARCHGINKWKCLGRKSLVFFPPFSEVENLWIFHANFVLLLILSVQAKSVVEICIRISGIFRTQLKKNLKSLIISFPFLLISQKAAALPKF